jgi:hypothetical protein
LRVARKLSEYDVVNKIRNGIENAWFTKTI